MKSADQPRFTKLEPFAPHRATFECKHEASVTPPITPEADALFEQAKLLTSYEFWPEQRDYVQAAELYEKAMKLGHWKAQFNLAGAYLRGKGVPQDIDKALALTEDLMKKGVPAAWDNMGAYYMGGLGPLKQDATVAYAFWQRAADMGSMAAQTYIGAKLLGTHDEPPSFWGNRSIGLKMLECAFEQGDGKAALELGVTLQGSDPSLNEDNAKALKVLHEGVKWGSESSANHLSSSFRQGDEVVGHGKDPLRSTRYSVLGDALYRNPDLRFPSLDKIIPLPPAPLPAWDGKKESLIKAAGGMLPELPNKYARSAPGPLTPSTSKPLQIFQAFSDTDETIPLPNSPYVVFLNGQAVDGGVTDAKGRVTTSHRVAGTAQEFVMQLFRFGIFSIHVDEKGGQLLEFLADQDFADWRKVCVFKPAYCVGKGFYWIQLFGQATHFEGEPYALTADGHTLTGTVGPKGYIFLPLDNPPELSAPIELRLCTGPAIRVSVGLNKSQSTASYVASTSAPALECKGSQLQSYMSEHMSLNQGMPYVFSEWSIGPVPVSATDEEQDNGKRKRTRSWFRRAKS